MAYALVIPALNPDGRLTALVDEILNRAPDASVDGAPEIIVVDDGSRADCRPLFDALAERPGCRVCRHDNNRGKGAALKTGMARAREIDGLRGVVTADADGQHSARDILRVLGALDAHPGAVILGARDFTGRGIPWKSRWGNRVTSLVFRLGTGVRCRDTQTGLRGIPAARLEDCLAIPGRRFDYEMNVLLRAAESAAPFHFVDIRTIYRDGNRSSHFRPVIDSALIYAGILKFGLSSLGSALLDLLCFYLLTRFAFGGTAAGILAATVSARVLSGTANFMVNRLWVFAAHARAGVQLVKYAALFVLQMSVSAALVWAFSQLPVPLMLAKILVDGALFFLSYHIQRRYIFRGGKPA